MATYQETIDLAKKALSANQPGVSIFTPEEQTRLGLSTISSDILRPSTLIDYKTPTPFPIPTIPSSENLFALTNPEEKASGLMENLRSLNEAQIGESAFRAQQEQVQGIPQLTQTQRDLTTQLNNLTREAQAIPLNIQSEFAGRGATAGGVAPIETGRLRENAIKALTVSSLLEASRGNLATAHDLVDRAVKAKYDPIREEIAVKKANLELLINSPEYTQAEKKRAQAQLDAQNKKEKEEKFNEQNYKDLNSGLIDIIKANPNIDARTLQTLGTAISPLQLAIMASNYGLKTTSGENLVFKEISRTDENGNTITRIVALDPKTGQEVTQPQARGNNINVFGIKSSSTTKGWGGVDSGVGASDGGTFLASQGIEGDRAIAQKLLTSGIYSNLTVDQALKKWSNQGYGAEAVTGVDPQAKIRDLPQNQIDAVLNGIMKREGIATGAGGLGNLESITPPKPKEPTAAQQTVAEYAARIEQSNPTFKTLESSITSMNKLTFPLLTKAPSWMQSSELQQYMQAARNFINAKLRRESGAVISPTEFKEAYAQYLPVPGDSSEVLKMKEANRNLVFASMRKQAGNAYSSVQELLGGTTLGGGETETYISPDGIEYIKGEDGLYYPS